MLCFYKNRCYWPENVEVHGRQPDVTINGSLGVESDVYLVVLSQADGLNLEYGLS